MKKTSKKKALLALVLAAMVLNLAACGNKGSNNAGGVDDGQDVTQNDAQPDKQDPDKSDPAEPDGEGQDAESTAGTVTASHTDVTLKKAGDSFRFLPVGVDGIYACTYTSADTAIATVDDSDGTVTAVAPGNTTVFMHVECSGGQYDFTCAVRCTWTDGGDGSALPDAITGTNAAPSSTPALTDFFDALKSSYEGLDSLGVLEGELLENYYPGLSALPVKEMLVQETMMSTQNCAVVLVKLADGASAKDITAVQDILSARIKTQAEGGAFYPASCEIWENGVITSVSNTVGMFVYPDEAQAMAADFTEAFSN